jgi:hypothetical protein
MDLDSKMLAIPSLACEHSMPDPAIAWPLPLPLVAGHFRQSDISQRLDFLRNEIAAERNALAGLLLVKNKAEVNVDDDLGQSLLHKASGSSLKITQALLGLDPKCPIYMTEDEREEYLEGLDKKVIWEMAEGKPKQDLEVDVDVTNHIISIDE